MSALADRHLGEAFVRLRLRLGQLPPEYLRLPALIHEGLTQQMPDYAAAVWRLEGLLGRELSGALDEAACVAASEGHAGRIWDIWGMIRENRSQR